tara:strand:+ start:309 stop:494 length:186 start_codon:yes stop_codon:yes gene_type:complete
MQRHITDQKRARQSAIRAREYLRMEREQVPDKATVELQQRPHTDGAGRLRQFLRIARGKIT